MMYKDTLQGVNIPNLVIWPALGTGLLVLWEFIQAYFLIGRYKNWRKLPPGPKRAFLSGTPGYPHDKAHLWFKSLSEKYGEIFSVWHGPNNLQVVLNSPKAIRDLCDKRGNIYNSRPKMFVFQDCIFRGISITATGYNDGWRKQRKIFNSLLSPAASKKFYPYQDYESKQYIYDILTSPDQFYEHAERFATSILTSTVYGIRADNITDPSAMGLILMGSWLEAQLHPSRYWEDQWPMLHKIPKTLAPWRASYDKNSQLLDDIAHAWWDPAKANVKNGKAVPCFATSFVDSYQSEGYTDDEAALITLSLMLAGAGTSAATQNFLIMGCLTNHEAVEKAHEELDRVIGSSRLPELSDEPNLPYTRAMIKETLRWRPFANSGFYHATTKDDVYNGYFIPKGTTIINNAYSVHNDELRFPDPDKFEPIRYINYPLSASEYANMADATKRDHFAYGAGRRICVGMSVAEPSLFLLASRFLWAFDVQYALDKNGKPISVDTYNYAGGTFGKPNPFPAKIIPRSPEHSSVVRQSFSAAHTDVRSLADATALGELPGMEALVEKLKRNPDVSSAVKALVETLK